MSKNQWIGLGVAVLLIAGAYVWVYGSNRLPPIEVMAVDLPGTPLLFSFNDDVSVEEVMVFRPADGADPDDELAYIEGEMMWHLVPRRPAEDEDERAEEEPDEPTRVKNLQYGRTTYGTQRAPGIPRRGHPLEVGVEYVFVATLAEGRAQTRFVHVEND